METLENTYLAIKKEDLEVMSFTVCEDIQKYLIDNPDKKDSFFIPVQVVKGG